MQSEWFECKVRYDKTLESGLIKKTTETYLVDALSFTEAEKRFIEEIKPYMSGEFMVTDIKRARIADLFDSEDIALKISEGYGVQLPIGDEPFVIHDLILTKAGTLALVLDGRFHGTQYEGYDSGFPGSWSVKDGKVSYAFEEDMPFVGRAGEGTIEFRCNWKDEPYCRFVLNGKDADIEFYMIPKTI